ncbi:MAG: phosphatidylglycerophosphatase A [Kiritimatiellae bacterium]|nr:phosphatidylglycerophosphatase A [Kiritimatiellia bacterium]
MDSKNGFFGKCCLFLASGFGLGLVAPFAPGTFGSLPGVAFAYLIAPFPLAARIFFAGLLALAAIPLCGKAEKILGIKDDGRIAADEWMLFPIATILVPIETLPWWWMAVFFAVVRAIDIIKPFPCRQLQAIHGGFGIVIDDFVANLYSLAANYAIFLYFIKQ